MKPRIDWTNSARGVALFFGVMSLIGGAVQFGRPGFDPNLEWLDLRALPIWSRQFIELGGGAILMTWSLAWKRPRWLSIASAIMAGGATVAMTLNGAVVVWLMVNWRTTHVDGRFPFPASFFFAALFAWLTWAAMKPGDGSAKRSFKPTLMAVALCLVGFPLLQIFCFGWTDYRRPGDVAVVFGARAYANGEPSMALADRVRMAADLYRNGLTRRLYFSGGRGDGAIHETESMRRLAISLGVPDSAIASDLQGLNTEATAAHTIDYLHSQRATRVLAVSEFYHLPRIKLCFQGRGAEVYTVPARPQEWLRAWPLGSIAREVPAFWLYYGRALAHS